jgi:hypothetical protein
MAGESTAAPDLGWVPEGPAREARAKVCAQGDPTVPATLGRQGL